MWSVILFIIVLSVCSKGSTNRLRESEFIFHDSWRFQTKAFLDSRTRNIHGVRFDISLDTVRGKEVARGCSRGCGQMGFCFERFCYRFPFEKFGLTPGSLVKNQFGSLVPCGLQCNASGSYCQSGIFDTGFCVLVTPAMEKCPDQVTLISSQPLCTGNCSDLCVQGHCCPDERIQDDHLIAVSRMLAEIRHGPSLFRTKIPCDPRGYPKKFIPYSGCVNGTVFLLRKQSEEVIQWTKFCYILPNGDFHVGCSSFEMCIHTAPEMFNCMMKPSRNIPKNRSDTAWISVYLLSFLTSIFFAFMMFIFLFLQ